MKKLLIAMGLALGASLYVPQASAITISLIPNQAHYSVGDFINVDVRVSGLGTEIVSAYDLNVYFNSAVIGSFRSASIFPAEFDNDWHFDAQFLPDNTGNVGWTWSLDDDLAASQTDDSFVFAGFGWSADADGFSFLNFGPDPDVERNVVGRDALSLNATFVGACVSVGTGSCTVPEPASLSLLGVALAGAFLPGALRRRRQARGA